MRSLANMLSAALWLSTLLLQGKCDLLEIPAS